MPVARIYVRVSTDSQTTANQKGDCVALARAALGTPVTLVNTHLYEETESAAKARPVFERLKSEARAGDVVIVWALDRLHRSMQGMVNDVLDFGRRGVAVRSVREPWLDTAGPVRDILIAFFGWVAQQERARLIERTRAGLDRARREGKTLGRPRMPLMTLGPAADAVKHGQSVATAARAFNLSESTLRRHLRSETPPKPA